VRVAFKEWAVVVDALLRGDQIIILRKGGISEGPGGFEPEHGRFLLFPTLFHQQRESVIAPAQARYDALAPTLSPSTVRVEAFAQVVDWRLLESLDEALRLSAQHIWREEMIRERFERGPSGSLYVMAVRVFQLSQPVDLPMQPHYGGCKSWIELDSPIPITDARPVLDDADFQKKFDMFEDALATKPASMA
jgi:hypothetical protein